MALSGLTDKSGSSFAVNGLNAIIRFLQFAVGIIVIGIYGYGRAQWRHEGYGSFGGDWAKFEVALAAGSLSVLTAIGFGVLPFLVSYYYVAVAFLWDWILFFVWCGALATQHSHFGNKSNVDDLRKSPEIKALDTLVAGQWICLCGMLVQLLPAIMGPACLLIDRKNLRSSRAAV